MAMARSGRRLSHVQRCLESPRASTAASAAPTLEPEPDGHHSMVFDGSLADSHLPGVSLEEAQFFKEHGLFVKRGLVSGIGSITCTTCCFWCLCCPWTFLSRLLACCQLDAEMLATAQDLLLCEAERLGPGFKRDDPSSWLAHPPDTWPVPPPAGSSPPEKDHRDYKGGTGTRNPITLGPSLWKHHIVGDADWILDLIPNNPAVRGIAESLLAGPVKPTRRARGVYTIFPTVEPTGLGHG